VTWGLETFAKADQMK